MAAVLMSVIKPSIYKGPDPNAAHIHGNHLHHLSQPTVGGGSGVLAWSVMDEGWGMLEDKVDKQIELQSMGAESFMPEGVAENLKFMLDVGNATDPAGQGYAIAKAIGMDELWKDRSSLNVGESVNNNQGMKM